ncbi:TolC family protein [Parabacteroides chinchillae]|uniref:Outer membrane protein TolC n=1 Tax=Parabacteroides chinchillae TaxID=871327 RepID=A0A8G2FAH6_9BACT|nr:TolC family protein [Parabacteroides chinchillae]SEF79283.1 Outer membrane protein TolC [Parabacteroides chinchillae]
MRNKIIIACLLLGALSVKAQDGRFSIEEYKQRVLEYSRQIKQSAEERIAMQHAVKAAKTAFFPAVDFSGNYQYRINKYELGMGDGIPGIEMDHNTYSLGATVNQPIYAGGQIYNNYKAAQVQGEIASQAEELTTDNIIYTADLNYWSAAARKGMYEVMCQYVDIVQELANVLTIRFNDGQISKTDLLQVESRLKEAELNKSSAYKDYQIALQNMNSLMGVSPMAPIIVTDSITMYQMLPLQVGEDVALRNRPEYTITQLDIEYQKRQINLSKAKYNPTLAIGFQGSWGTPMLNVKGSDLLWTPAVFASLKIPLFHWGARFKEVNSQKALLRSKEYAMDNTRDQIANEVANAWTSLKENTKQITVAEEACKIAEENLDLNTFSYNEGKLPILDVLSAQLSWIQSYSSLIQTWYQQKASLAQYNKAIGLRRLQ